MPENWTGGGRRSSDTYQSLDKGRGGVLGAPPAPARVAHLGEDVRDFLHRHVRRDAAQCQLLRGPGAVQMELRRAPCSIEADAGFFSEKPGASGILTAKIQYRDLAKNWPEPKFRLRNSTSHARFLISPSEFACRAQKILILCR